MDDDPGWAIDWKMIPLAFIPQVAARRMSRSSHRDGLLDLRTLFLTFCTMLVLICTVAVPFADITDGREHPAVSVAIVVITGILAQVVQRVNSTPLDCTSAKTLAATYWTRFFLRTALSESTALIAFALGIALGPWWVFFIGAAFAAIGFAQLAPTKRNLLRDQDALSLRGCAESLVAALRQPRTNAPNRGDEA